MKELKNELEIMINQGETLVEQVRKTLEYNQGLSTAIHQIWESNNNLDWKIVRGDVLETAMDPERTLAKQVAQTVECNQVNLPAIPQMHVICNSQEYKTIREITSSEDFQKTQASLENMLKIKDSLTDQFAAFNELSNKVYSSNSQLINDFEKYYGSLKFDHRIKSSVLAQAANELASSQKPSIFDDDSYLYLSKPKSTNIVINFNPTINIGIKADCDEDEETSAN